jgi:hypothetical protein
VSAEASMRPAFVHERSAATVRRGPALPPVLTRDP